MNDTTIQPLPFTVARTYDVPADVMWKAWTERERMMQWFGPKAFTMPVATMDLRPGGSFHYCLRDTEGNEMWGKFIYREIVAPERIVLVNSFSDESGGLTRHPWSPTWPLEMLSTTTFVEQDGRTTVTVDWLPLNASEEEVKTFNAAHKDCEAGWNGTFEQLAAYLSTQQQPGK